MATPEALREGIKNIIIEKNVFGNIIKDGKIDNQAGDHLKNLFSFIESEIGLQLTEKKDKEELMSIITEEFQKAAIERGLSQEQVKKLFEKEINNLTKKVDIGNIPAAEINKPQIEYNIAYQKEKENIIENTQDTTKELTTLKNNFSLDQYLSETNNKIDDVRTRLNFMKRGEGRDVRHTANYIKDWLRNAEFRINKFKKYDEKFGLQDIKLDHIKAMCLKLNTLLANSNDYISQGITGDLNEAKRYFPPNFFDDKSYYIPDVLSGDFNQNKEKSGINSSDNTNNCNITNDVVEHNGTVGEQFAENGVLGALNAGLEKVGASTETRSRAYNVGNIVRSATKVIGTVWAGWNFLKSAWKTISGDKKADGSGYFGDVAKYGGLLAAGYVAGPAVDKLIRGGDTSKRASELFGTSTGKTPAEIKENKKNAEIKIDAEISAGLFKDIPRKDWKEFTNSQGTIDFEKLKGYLLQKEGVEGIRYKALQELSVNNNLGRVQNFLTAMGINELYITQKIKNNPEETISKTYEEAKRQGDKIAESYDRNDSAKVRNQIDSIESEMIKDTDPNFAEFKAKRMDIEKELNILYIKHEKARPIKITYNTTSKQIEIETYQQKSTLELGSVSGVRTGYNTESRKTTGLNESIRISNLMNFLIGPQSPIINKSSIEKPFHLSSLKGDIEFEKENRREALKQLKYNNLKDISVLNDSFRSPRLEELYPSIANNKQAFINWLNNFKKNGKSIWKK